MTSAPLSISPFAHLYFSGWGHLHNLSNSLWRKHETLGVPQIMLLYRNGAAGIRPNYFRLYIYLFYNPSPAGRTFISGSEIEIYELLSFSHMLPSMITSEFDCALVPYFHRVNIPRINCGIGALGYCFPSPFQLNTKPSQIWSYPFIRLVL
jgi:hypothetical protein